MEIRVRLMTAEDIEQAVRVEESSFSRPWTAEIFHASLLLPYVRYYVAETEAAGIIGICGLRNIAGEGEITNVGVLPLYRRNGAAQQMLKFLLRDGGNWGIEAFTLEVRAGNAPAIALYRKNGFHTEGKRTDFYELPREDALIMWRRREEMQK